MTARYRALAALLLFTALNAIGGGIYGLAGARDVPREWLSGSPFSTYLIPSVILLVIVGGSQLLAGIAVLRQTERARKLALLAGTILASWITVQVATIGFVSWLQPAMATVAIATIALALRLRTPIGRGLGLERGVVRLVDYDPIWPHLFNEEAARIHASVGSDLPLALEHMGSTAVPGLAAKPILDILGGYPPGANVAPYINALARAGYAHRGEQGIPGREFFRRGDPRAYHLHLAEQGGVFWREHLAFRDAMRGSTEVRDAYGRVKAELAKRFPRDRPAYIEGKTEFVRSIVNRSSAGDA